MTEAGIHFELYRHLENAIDEDPNRGKRTYETLVPEYGEGIRGYADLVLFDSTNEPVLVIEAKRPSGESNRKAIDPYSPSVIRQAFDYAAELGSPYFATYNGERFVLFRTFEEGKQLLQRSTKSYAVSGVEKFADTILDEIERLEVGEDEWDSLDNAFIQRIRSLHELITPELRETLTDYLDNNEAFFDSFVSWANTQGFDYSDAGSEEKANIRRNFSEQAAYLLVNKIVFYKILEKSEAYRDEIRPLAVSVHRVQEDLEDHFTEVVDQVDFEAIFEHDEIYSEIPIDCVGDRIREFIIELDEQNLTQFDSDVIGRIYEGVIPAERRHDLGEYYTPPAICDLITQLTIQDSDDRVLDPACGSGGFLVSAYNRKRSLFAEERGSHGRILTGLYGVDINRFPAHLTAINLAIQNIEEYTEQVNIEVNDFFELTPDTQRFGRERADSSGKESEEGLVNALGSMDAIVGNPPYIRQENIENKDSVREHLSRVDGEHLSRRSDIYTYFLTHATEFLDSGGRIGFITSDRWLDTSYGADLQKFILDNYRVESVIKFSQQAFEDALVGSCVVVLSKESNKEKRDEHVAKFIQVNDSMDIDEIVSLVENSSEPNKLVRSPDYRLVTRRQEILNSEDKWTTFFNAPPVYFDTIGRDGICALSDVAEVTRGFTSGANDFYFGRTEEWEELGLEQYTEPLLKATGQLSRIRFDEEAGEEWGYLSIHHLVEKAKSEMEHSYQDIPEETQIKRWLADNGHKNLAEYIEWGEDQGYHDRPTTSSRDIWFDLGELDAPPMVMASFTWREHRIVWNEVGALGSNQFYYIIPNDGVDAKTLCGILNSRLAWLMFELRGRWAEGASMARSRLMVYEAEELPILDPRTLSEKERHSIRESFDDLIERELELGEEASVETTEKKRDNLDQAVLRSLEMDNRLEEFKSGVDRMVSMREQAGGEETNVLVERPKETEVIELEGVSESRESTTLGDF